MISHPTPTSGDGGAGVALIIVFFAPASGRSPIALKPGERVFLSPPMYPWVGFGFGPLRMGRLAGWTQNWVAQVRPLKERELFCI